MRTNEAAGSVPAGEFRAVASTYGNLACVYVNDVFGEADRTVVSVFFEHGGERFKHFTFVLGQGKTRVTLTELVVGKYHAEAVQFGSGGESVTAEVDFEITAP